MTHPNAVVGPASPSLVNSGFTESGFTECDGEYAARDALAYRRGMRLEFSLDILFRSPAKQGLLPAAVNY